MPDERTTARHLVLAAVQRGATKAADIKSSKLKAAERTALIAELVGEGLLAAATKGRSLTLSLTPAGEQACAALAAEAQAAAVDPDRAPRAPRGRASETPAVAAALDALSERVAHLESVLLTRLVAIEARLEAGPGLPGSPRPPSPGRASSAVLPDGSTEAPPDARAPVALLKEAILAAVATLDQRNRHGGMVPIPALRRELRARGHLATDSEVNAALLALEHDYAIDLLVAQSPTTLPDRAAGIERPGKGLAYYVAPRSS